LLVCTKHQSQVKSLITLNPDKHGSKTFSNWNDPDEISAETCSNEHPCPNEINEPLETIEEVDEVEEEAEVEEEKIEDNDEKSKGTSWQPNKFLLVLLAAAQSSFLL